MKTEKTKQTKKHETKRLLMIEGVYTIGTDDQRLLDAIDRVNASYLKYKKRVRKFLLTKKLLGYE